MVLTSVPHSNYKSGGLNLNAGHFAQLSEWDFFLFFVADGECSCVDVPSTNSISILSLSVRCILHVTC
jgi:hypothetical protein